jgi:hypothetical protein
MSTETIPPCPLTSGASKLNKSLTFGVMAPAYFSMDYLSSRSG